MSRVTTLLLIIAVLLCASGVIGIMFRISEILPFFYMMYLALTGQNIMVVFPSPQHPLGAESP
jgi:hypothetical protein